MKKLLLLFALILFVTDNTIKADNTVQMLKEKYCDILLASDIRDRDSKYIRALNNLPADNELSDRCIVELYQRKSITQEDIEHILSTLQDDGSWSDINYQDKTRSGWKVKEHVERIFPMCRYYRYLKANKQITEAEELFGSIEKSIRWWADHNPISPNWWHNEVGIPKTFGSALLLVWDELPADLQQKLNKVVFEQHVHFGRTGQNKVWKAGNMLFRGLLNDDKDMVQAARDAIASEIKAAKDEGIQKDWSYHQHGAMQQFGNYGLAYISTMCVYYELFENTPFAFTPDQHNILLNLVEQGYSWVVWNEHLDVNSLNRQLFKNAASIKYLVIEFCSRSLQGREVSRPLGNKHFFCSDMTTHHTKHWMASVKMASNRVAGSEQMNGDNQHGYYTADGATYVYTHGKEYDNIFPLWDWHKIPGITCYLSDKPVPQEEDKVSRRNKTDFVGGVSDGMLGITAMKLNRNGIKAKKAWIFAEDYLLCLGTDIKTDSLPVATTIEQCLAAEGEQWYECADGRYLLDDKGYIILDGAQPKASVETRTGDWHNVMKTYKPCTVKGNVAMMYIDHGKTHHGTYQYMITPSVTAKSLKRFDTNKIKVHANTAEWQLVETPKAIFAVVYSKAHQFTTSNGKATIEFDQPGIYLLKKVNDEWVKKYMDPTAKR